MRPIRFVALLAMLVLAAVLLASGSAAASTKAAPRLLAQGSSCSQGSTFRGTNGYVATTFATGIPTGPLGTNSCDGVFGFAFDGDDNVYASDQFDGNLYRFPSTGGSASPSTYLGHSLGPGAYELAFGRGGALYGIEPATGGNVSAGAVVQLNSGSGDVVRTVTRSLMLPTWVAADPLTGDLYVTNGGTGGNFSPDLWRIRDPASTNPAHPPRVSVYATDSNGFNAVAVAPDGTVYAETRDARLVRFGAPYTDQLAHETTITTIPSNSIFGLALGNIDSNGAPTSVYIDSSNIDEVDLATKKVTPILTGVNGSTLGNMRMGPNGCLYVANGAKILTVSTTQGTCASFSDLAAYVPTPAQIDWGLTSVAQSWFWVALLIVLVESSSILFNATLDANYAEINGWFAPLRRRLLRTAGAKEHTGEPTTWRGWRRLTVYLLLAGAIYSLRAPSIGTFADFVVGIGAGSIAGMEVNKRRMARRHQKMGEPFARPATLLVAAVFVAISVAASARPGYVFGIVLGLTFEPALEEAESGALAAVGALLALGIGAAAWFVRWPIAYGLDAHPSAIHSFVSDVLAVIFVSSIFSVAFGMAPLRFLPGSSVRAWNREAWIVLWALGLFALVHILESGYGYSSASQERIPTLVLGIGLLAFSVAFWAYFRQRDARAAPDASGPASAPITAAAAPSASSGSVAPVAFPKE